MDKPGKPRAKWNPLRFPLHRRIRNRREELGLTAVELARIVRVSPSYISLIENGEKIPGAEVAASIALALGDDPGLYVAWTHSTRHEDPERQLRDLARLRDYSSDPALLERLESGEDLEEVGPAESGQPHDEQAEEERIAAEPEADDRFDLMTLGSPRLKSVLGEVDDAMFRKRQSAVQAGELPYPGMIEIPVLEDGADPGDDPVHSGRAIDVVRFDPRALPLETTGRLFAYRPGRSFLRRVEDLIRPGDLVILTSRMGRLAPDRIHAVRHEGEILLSRLLYERNALLLLPGGDSARIDVIEVPERRELPRIVAGSVVTTIRNWGRREGEAERRDVASRRLGRLHRLETRPAGTGPPGTRGARPRWRAAELRGRYLVRDCEWKRRYGWRPVQRAADLDFLEQNPGIRIRFRLIRDGAVRYHLELDADEWREALGDHADGPGWRRNGFIVPVTRMRDGEYTEEFKDRWAPFVKRAQ